MRLHSNHDVFEELYILTSQWLHIPTNAVVKIILLRLL